MADLTDIPGFESFTEIKPITKGWSEDKKYCVIKADGTKYLLRISPIERYEIRKSLFEMMKKVSALGIPMCKPVEFGVCPDGVYVLHNWIEGEDLSDVLPNLSETEQYELGLKAGEILQVIHSIPAPENQVNWAERVNRKIDTKMKKYQECGIKIDGDDNFIKYIEQNRYLLENRPQCFQHDDYHVGNMMLENGELIIIDFDRSDYGDPWEEFKSITWNAQLSASFATGQVNGYFEGEPPLEFFKLLAFYISGGSLAHVLGAVTWGQHEIDVALNLASNVLKWYDNMNNPVPTWYLRDFK
ncbi:MAG: phosphotransferase [Oscillospiraceae bacterium]|nr:phosphotransferase [Oscillospiraceae bacterium]